MSFLKDLGIGGLSGAMSGGGNPLAGAMGGLSGMVGGPMSGIGILKMLMGGGDDKSGEKSTTQVNPGYTPSTPQPNGAARGLGRAIGADPSRISSIATSIGRGANAVASAGGAQGGYEAAPQMPIINNQMQLLDPRIIQQLMRHFNGGGTGQIQ